MNRILQHCGIRLPPGPLDKLWRYHRLIREHNSDRDLTRIVRFESMVLKHYADCMIVGHFVKFPSPLADIGTGAGFPGIPLKIRYPGIELILVEPRPRRVEFLELVIRELDLKGVTVVGHKATDRRFDIPVQAIITRALEPVAETLERVDSALAVGGLAIFMKGPAGEDEIQPALEAHGNKYVLVKEEAYTLGETEHHRRVLILKRVG